MATTDNDPLTLLFRADASVRHGTGHVMRCLALAQAWKSAGGRAEFLLAESTPGLIDRLHAEDLTVTHANLRSGTDADADETVRAAMESGANWIVADGYNFGSAWQGKIKAAGIRLLLLDDYGHAEHYSADIVLNQNLHASVRTYASRETHTHLLLGARYALLRDEFVENKKEERQIPAQARRILITLGGTDPDNVTRDVMEVLSGLRDVEVMAVVGGSNPHLDSIRGYVADYGPAFDLAINAHNMPKLMQWADVAIAAGGTTSWELAFSRLPGLIITLADNQEAISRALDHAGLGIGIGRWNQQARERLATELPQLLADAERRRQMSAQGRKLVDGYGRARVQAWMRSMSLGLRRVEENDARLLWEWANDPVTRAASFSPEPIPWDSHLRWFAEKLASAGSYYYIISDEWNVPLGQVRFDLEGPRAVISVSLAQQKRGKGYGAAAIIRATTELMRTTTTKAVDAFVKPENKQSILAFIKADFDDHGIATAASGPAQRLVYERRDS